MKNYDALDELVPKTQELHRAIFDKGYEQGQADALDKIKAEIEREIIYKPMEMPDYRMGLIKSLEIINKHKEADKEELK
jgi:hypothetical protein